MQVFSLFDVPTDGLQIYLNRMPKGTDINQFFDVGLVFQVQNDVLCSFDLGIGEDAFAIL